MVSRCLNVSPLWERERCMNDADHRPVTLSFASKAQEMKIRPHLARVRLVMRGETIEEGKNYPLHFQNCYYFTRRSAYEIRSPRFVSTTSEKVTAQERSKRAGATRLFGWWDLLTSRLYSSLEIITTAGGPGLKNAGTSARQPNGRIIREGLPTTLTELRMRKTSRTPGEPLRESLHCLARIIDCWGGWYNGSVAIYASA